MCTKQIQQEKGQRHHAERKRIARRSDERCKQNHREDGDAPAVPEHLLCHDSQSRKQRYQHGKLEHQAEKQHGRIDRGHIGGQ